MHAAYSQLKVAGTEAAQFVIQGMCTMSYHVVAKPLLTASGGLIRRCVRLYSSGRRNRYQQVPVELLRAVDGRIRRDLTASQCTAAFAR